MSIIERIRVDAAAKCPTVVLPESTDERTLRAAVEVNKLGIARPILLGDKKELDALASSIGVDLSGVECRDIAALSRSEALQACLRTRKWYTGLPASELAEILQEPLALACALLATDEVDACVAGAIHSTSEVLSRGLRIIGTSKESPLLSSFLLMVFATPPVQGQDYAVYADCAININPDCEQLAQIAASTAKSAESLFGLDPRVALLSFSSAGSANHPDVEKVVCATLLLAEQQPQLKVIGEAQFDTALLPSIRQAKMPDAAYTEPANVFVFPNLDSGNIGHKIAERVGGAKVIGPILQGLNKPLNDLSRGATVDGIINTVAMTCLQV